MIHASSLSPAQARFAEAHQATDFLRYGASPAGSVYVYREQPGCTERWHVALDGTELDSDRLHYT